MEFGYFLSVHPLFLDPHAGFFFFIAAWKFCVEPEWICQSSVWLFCIFRMRFDADEWKEKKLLNTETLTLKIDSGSRPNQTVYIIYFCMFVLPDAFLTDAKLPDVSPLRDGKWSGG